MTADEDRWKSKYLDLLDEQDQQKKHFKDQIDVLRRSIIRLSLVAEGRQPDIDNQLESLRNRLRKVQVSGLGHILEQIERHHEHWQQREEGHRHQIYNALLILDTESDYLPKSLQPSLKRIRKKCRTHNSTDLLLALVDLLMNWVNIAESNITPRADSAPSSWFKKLLKGSPQPPKLASLDTQPESQQYHIDDVDDQLQGVNQLTFEICQLLHGLIQKLTLPPAIQPKAIQLLAQVKDGVGWYELVPTLETLTELILASLGNEQAEFEIFLNTLNGRLSTLQIWLKKSETLTEDFRDASQQFDETMRHHLTDLQKTLNADDQHYQNLKNSVTSKLDNIFHTVDHFRDTQQQKEHLFEEHINGLQKRLEDMEGELQAAQTQLQESQLNAMTDSLTGLPNRGAFDVHMQSEFDRYRRYGNPLSLVVCDVDKFKHINDTHGHQAGDRVLQLISQQVKKGTRDTDLLARYGGEEFVVILPETDSEGAHQVAEKIRKQVESSPFHFKGKRVQITISCGIASFTPECQPEHVFEAADRALYAAKEGGRNQCQIGDVH